jgi:2-C-methyl-D-erythritol 2,4-cyclodiphosphate synthase
MKNRTGLGQDSHRFDFGNQDKILILAGVEIPGEPPLRGNSDADVVLHALINAISGVSGVNILGAVADRLCLEQGITDSRVYLAEALKTLGRQRIHHVSISIEAKRPKLSPWIPEMKRNLARLLGIAEQEVGLTATSGEGLTDFGRGEGIQALAVIDTEEAVD